MSFIDFSYFTGEINIPNASSDAGLTQAITQYEKEILIQLLGYKLYTLLMADLVDGVPVAQKYVDLVNGAEFVHTYSGAEVTLKWEGLKNTTKESLIAYYVFYKYVERNITFHYGTGVSMSKSGEGWERVSPVNKLCAVWERMRELYGKVPPEHKSFYSNPGSVYNGDASAYNFLYVNSADYPDWIFTPQWNINAFGI